MTGKDIKVSKLGCWQVNNNIAYIILFRWKFAAPPPYPQKEQMAAAASYLLFVKRQDFQIPAQELQKKQHLILQLVCLNPAKPQSLSREVSLLRKNPFY